MCASSNNACLCLLQRAPWLFLLCDSRATTTEYILLAICYATMLYITPGSRFALWIADRGVVWDIRQH